MFIRGVYELQTRKIQIAVRCNFQKNYSVTVWLWSNLGFYSALRIYLPSRRNQKRIKLGVLFLLFSSESFVSLSAFYEFNN